MDLVQNQINQWNYALCVEKAEELSAVAVKPPTSGGGYKAIT